MTQISWKHKSSQFFVLTVALSLLVLVATPLPALAKSAPASLSEVTDPYRWLEDSTHPSTHEWLKKQESLFKSYIKGNPYRSEIKKTLENVLNFESYSIPLILPDSDHTLFRRRLPSEDQGVLFIQEGLNNSPRPLINPNLLSQNSPVALKDYVPSPDGKLLAYGLSESGSDWTVWKVLDISSAEDQTDRIEKVKFFSIAWSADSLGFFYTRLDDDDVFRVYYHLLGNEQSSDQQYLLINVTKGSAGANEILYRPLNEPILPFSPLISMNGSNYQYLKNLGSTFYLWTNHEAPLGKLITRDLSNKTETTLIPESQDSLNQVIPAGNYFIVGYSENAISRLDLYDLAGNFLRKIKLPGMGSVAFVNSPFSGYENHEEIFFSFTNFFQPPVIYRYTIETDKLEIFKKPSLPFHPNDYAIRQDFFTSKDGTKIPLFIVHKKDLELDSSHETLLYGYGGFNISSYPTYSSLNMSWLENGGVIALANIRGGGEYGKAWHEGGKRGNKQNSFDDFIAAAEYLIANGYTNSSKLAIRGASNGGLLTAVCLNQRPDLFGAGMVEVAVLDMLRFPLFTGGRFWMDEYGNPHDSEDFKILYRYSPYHNVRTDGKYPPILITTGDHDDRVVPLHSYKYAAAMQENLSHEGKVLLRVDRQGGHGAGKSISQWIEEAADILSFLKQELSD